MRCVIAGFVGIAVLLWFAGLLSGELPQWHAGGSRIVEHRSLSPVGDYPITIAHKARLILQGDSNVRARPPVDDARALPALLRQRLGSSVEVVVRSFGGDTVLLGARRWPIGTCPGDLVILHYGTNDAASRGWMASRGPVPVPVYQARLAQLARKFTRTGARVLILAPLPAGARAMDRRIAPYRSAARRAAIEASVQFLDPVDAFNPEGIVEAELGYDALHLNASGHERLTGWLAQRIAIGKPAAKERACPKVDKLTKIPSAR